MHFSNAHTFAEPFDEEFHFNQNFLLKVLKAKLEQSLGEQLEDETFIELVRAAHRSNGSGPLSYGPIMGPPQPFINYYKLKGYNTISARDKGHKACSFFFGGTNIFGKKQDHVKIFDSLILHIPHSGTMFLNERAAYVNELAWNARDVIDWFTDELFTPSAADSRIIPVVFPYCRTECDVERLIDDPLEKKNLGICYDSHISYKENGFFKLPDKSFWHYDRHDYKLYIDHHQKMERLLLEHNEPLLIDCHSFSSHPTVLQPDYDQNKQYDICIGYNDDKTKPDDMIIGTIRSHFESYGYRVGINCPYSNSKTFNVPTPYKSIMIEVNKRCYMDELTYHVGDNMKKMHECIELLYPRLLK